MKIRSSFVTNSSSSSYLISYKSKFDKTTLEKYPFLIHYDEIISKHFPDEDPNMRNQYDGEDTNKYVIKSKDDVEEYFQRIFWTEDSIDKILTERPEYQKLYDDINKKLNEGYAFVTLSYVDYSDSNQELKELAEKGIIEIIKEEHD